MIILLLKVLVSFNHIIKTTDMSLRKTVTKDENFCFSKPQTFDTDMVQTDMRQADKILEQELRVCGTKEYMDTLTLSTSLLEVPEMFFYLMVCNFFKLL